MERWYFTIAGWKVFVVENLEKIFNIHKCRVYFRNPHYYSVNIGAFKGATMNSTD